MHLLVLFLIRTVARRNTQFVAGTMRRAIENRYASSTTQPRMQESEGSNETARRICTPAHVGVIICPSKIPTG